jgi:hypothetical protein
MPALHTPTRSLLKQLLLAGIILSAITSYSQVIPAPGLQVGSANTATADPTVPRPNTTPCTVTLFSNIPFADFSSKFFTFTPPSACPGPWAKVVLEADFSIEAGRQFDRTANIWVGGANVYFGTTSEPSRTVARSWHIERDLTDYSALFNNSQNGRVDLGNLVNSTFTSTLFGTAQLQFYPLSGHGDAPDTADMVLPLSGSNTGGTVFLSNTASALSANFNLPTNVERAYLDVIAQSQSNDEFWYTCVPNDVANELQSCGATGFRETEVTIDGQPAGVAPVYPWIYTGGIDPLLWRPIPGVQTLNFVPYRVDLTPFAGQLSNGKPHQVSVNVFNANSGFSTTATLLVFLDHGSTQVTGAVTKNTLVAAPIPNVTENVATDASGNITGNVAVTSNRSFRVEGFVRASHGRVETSVEQNIRFSNSQDFNISGLVFIQNITQNTSISSLTNTRGSHQGGKTSFQTFEWPLTVDINFTVNADGSGGFQTTTIKQTFNHNQLIRRGDGPDFFSTVSNTVAPTDTLLFDANFNITGGQGQASSQHYFSRDSTGACFSRSIAADGGILTSIIDGEGCKGHHD